jgi:hypothetical protein
MKQDWHFFIYQLPDDWVEPENAGSLHSLLGFQVPRLQLTGRDLQTPFELKFDDVQSQFERIDGGYCEWDGAFGWHPLDDTETRMCGTIHCLDERVMCFELHARLHLTSWHQLKSILGLDDRLAIQFPEYGALVSQATFAQMLQPVSND